MRCPECGGSHPDGARFCPNTGREISPGWRRPAARARSAAVVAICVSVVVIAASAVGIVAGLRQAEERERLAMPHEVPLTIVAPGYDAASDTPVPLSVTGSDASGREVSRTLGVSLEDQLELGAGSYDLRVVASPLTAAGVVYEVPDEACHLEVPVGAPERLEEGCSFELSPMGADGLSEDALAEALADSVEAARGVGCEEELAQSHAQTAFAHYEGLWEESEPPAEEDEPAEEPPAKTDEAAEEPEFVRNARLGLHVPDDPSITYRVFDPYYWEGAGIWVTPVTFYRGEDVVASADCDDQGNPIKSLNGYVP